MSKKKQIDTPTLVPTLVPTQTNSPTDELMQIEEMAEVYYKARLKARETLGSMNEGEEMWYSKAFFEAGYRKQSEGENVAMYPSSAFECSECHWEDWDLYTADSGYNFCPNCGAKMKGGAE